MADEEPDPENKWSFRRLRELEDSDKEYLKGRGLNTPCEFGPKRVASGSTTIRITNSDEARRTPLVVGAHFDFYFGSVVNWGLLEIERRAA